MVWVRIGRMHLMRVKEYNLIIYRYENKYCGRISQSGSIILDEYLSADKLKRAKKRLITEFLKFYDTTL